MKNIKRQKPLLVKTVTRRRHAIDPSRPLPVSPGVDSRKHGKQSAESSGNTVQSRSRHQPNTARPLSYLRTEALWRETGLSSHFSTSTPPSTADPSGMELPERTPLKEITGRMTSPSPLVISVSAAAPIFNSPCLCAPRHLSGPLGSVSLLGRGTGGLVTTSHREPRGAVRGGEGR